MRANELCPNGLFVKICGVTTVEDALLAVAMGADSIGFNFVNGSSRQIGVGQAADIAKRLPSEVTTLGVFRNESPERVIDICLRAGLTGAQLHGTETPEQCAEVASKLRVTIQAFPAGGRSLDRVPRYPVEIILLDNPNPGSGQVFDWSLADGLPDGKKLLLAGGLQPGNVGDAIAAVFPWGVDVASGVESKPGIKDAQKTMEFVRAARSAWERQLELRRLSDPNFGKPAPSGDVVYDWADED